MKNQEWTDLTESLTLKDVNITGDVLGRFGIYTVKQSYENKSGKTLEVFYTFPLSKTASVYDFTAKIGDKTIRGIVKEKSQAKKAYQRAIVRGDSAYLLDRESDNVFTVTLGKIAEGENAEIVLSYIDVHDITDNTIEVRIPTVIAPRYNDPITSRQTYRKDSGYKADITVNIDKVLKIADIYSPSHSVKIENNTVTALNAKLNKDYILYIKLKDEIISGGYVCKTGNESYAFLQFLPEFSQPDKHVPQKFIFLVDCSGSMKGVKIDKTKTALKKCLLQLRQNDEFAVIRFGSHFDKVNKFTQVSEQNIKNAIDSINTFSANYGGTEIWQPIKHALKKFKGKKTLVLLTDGQVGRAYDITEWIRRNIGENRLFCFGIDSAVNDADLTSFAKAGRGKAEFFTPDEYLDEKIARQFSRINGYECAAVSLNCRRNKTDDVLTSEEALFNHEYWCAMIKASELTDNISLVCKTHDKTVSYVMCLSDLHPTKIALDKVYAKQKINRIEEYIERNKYHEDVSDYKKQIVDIAVRYNIDSKYTSFLAINERENKLYGVPEQKQINSETPDRWDHSETYSADRSRRDNHNNFMYSCLFNFDDTDFFESENSIKAANAPADAEDKTESKSANKYLFNGNVYPRNKLVLAVIKDYAEKNHVSFNELSGIFQPSLQGAIGVFKRVETAEKLKDYRAHFFTAENDVVTLTDGKIYVCNQWGFLNIPRFIAKAKELGYTIQGIN